MKLNRVLLAGFLIVGFLALGSVSVAAEAQEASEPETAEPTYSRRGADSCLRCHGENSERSAVAIFNTPHGSRVNPDSPFAGAQCESCHGPSGAHERRPRGEDKPLNFGRNSTAPAAEQNEVCLGCHSDHDRMGWFGSAHESEEVSCASCHTIHAEDDPMEDSIAQQEVCFDCHPRNRSQALMPSSHPLRFGQMSCSDCHDPHNGMNDAQLVRATTNDTCYDCHAEKRGPMLWEHAPVTEDCALCHEPHGSNHAAMLKQRPPLLCQQCHMPSGHPSLAYTSESREDNYASRFLLGGSCTNCHSQVHGSNHPSGVSLTR